MGGKGWLWALGGVVVASAVWAGLLFATGGFGSDEPEADLRGYHYTSNLCASTDTSPFESDGYERSDPSGGQQNPQRSSSTDPALDTMSCRVDMKSTSSTDSYSSTWVYTTAHLHKKTDPEPEFEPQYRTYEDQKTSTGGYSVEKVTGLGDEAYVVTQDESGSGSTGAYVILGVREGWMTYEMTWSEYVSTSGGATPASASKVKRMLKESAETTLSRLKEK